MPLGLLEQLIPTPQTQVDAGAGRDETEGMMHFKLFMSGASDFWWDWDWLCSG